MAKSSKEATCTKPMTKSQLMSELAERCGMSKKQAADVYQALLDIAAGEAKKSCGFVFPGLGKLVKVDRAARTGRNPATNEIIQIPAKTAVCFRISKICKDAVLS